MRNNENQMNERFQFGSEKPGKEFSIDHYIDAFGKAGAERPTPKRELFQFSRA
jgi:hypothetical protein